MSAASKTIASMSTPLAAPDALSVGDATARTLSGIPPSECHQTRAIDKVVEPKTRDIDLVIGPSQWNEPSADPVWAHRATLALSAFVDGPLLPREVVHAVGHAMGVRSSLDALNALAACELLGLVKFDGQHWHRVEEPSPKQVQASGWDGTYRSAWTRLWL